MQLHYFPAQRQSQAGAAPAGADLHEGLEDAGLLTVGDTFAVILDRQQQLLILQRRAQPYGAAGAAVADGIGQQVVQHPLDLQSIQLHGGQIGGAMHLQGQVLLFGVTDEALAGTAQQSLDRTGAAFERLQPVLVAGKIQQLVDQPHQPVHLLIHGAQQFALPRLGRKPQAFQQQGEGHVHTGHRGTQFMGGAQYELAADTLEGALFGDVVQHHHHTQQAPAGMTDRGDAVGQQP